MICEWNLLFWRLELAYLREKKELSLDDLAGLVKKTAIPQHGPQNKLTNLYNYGHVAIFASFLAFPRPRSSLITVVSLANLHKQPKALVRYYVTSHWQMEWVKKRRWKTIELPPPSPLVTVKQSFIVSQIASCPVVLS